MDEDIQQEMQRIENEIERENAFISFLNHPSFKYLEKQAEDEIKLFQEELYNGGKPSAGDLDHLKVNIARVEILVRKNFLDLIRGSVQRLDNYQNHLRELKNGGSNNG